ncbi:hypothetical protein Hdeb2414_s0023g00634131 [Helianthus debilis subsp. tardiflorus]
MPFFFCSDSKSPQDIVERKQSVFVPLSKRVTVCASHPLNGTIVAGTMHLCKIGDGDDDDDYDDDDNDDDDDDDHDDDDNDNDDDNDEDDDEQS